MNPKFLLYIVVTAAIFAVGYQVGTVRAAGSNRVFELRTYTTEPGKLDALVARFRDHTTKLFEKHGMTNIGYWVPEDEPKSKNTLIYILAFPNRDAAKKSWDAFRNDPDWKKAQAESEASGKIVTKVDSVYMDPTDFSKLK
jgi:NIPSNAP